MKENATKENVQSTDDLWRQYGIRRDIELRNLLVSRYLHLVRSTADWICQDLPDCVEREELYGIGVLGLMQAIEKFDHAQGAKFETYCAPRIRGAILDELRRFDWMPRVLRTKANKVRRAHSAMLHALGRKPFDDEVADSLGLSESEYNAIALHAARPAPCSLVTGRPKANSGMMGIDVIEDTKSPNPAREMEKRELKQLVADIIKSLPETDRLVVLLYYYDRLTMRQIGEVLRMSESRVCQIHGELLEKLQRKLDSRKDELAAFA